MIETTVLQTALNEANAFGVDFSDFISIGGPMHAVDALITGGSGSSSGSSSGGSGGGSGSAGGSGGSTGGSTVVVPADNTGHGLVSSPGKTGGPATLKLGIVH